MMTMTMTTLVIHIVIGIVTVICIVIVIFILLVIVKLSVLSSSSLPRTTHRGGGREALFEVATGIVRALIPCTNPYLEVPFWTCRA